MQLHLIPEGRPRTVNLLLNPQNLAFLRATSGGGCQDPHYLTIGSRYPSPPPGSCTACDVNARCSQAAFPFACLCIPGFEGNGSYCLGVPPDPFDPWGP